MTTPNKAEVCKNLSCVRGARVRLKYGMWYVDGDCHDCKGTGLATLDECVCAETGFRNCPVHQNEPPERKRWARIYDETKAPFSLKSQNHEFKCEAVALAAIKMEKLQRP